MRPIDSETVKEYLKRVIWGADTKIDTWVEAMPTVDAIPVEWLNKQCEMADDRGDMEMTDAISWLIQTWHEEQEAQDG